MNQIHKKRLLNVAKAFRETKHATAFDMGHWGFKYFYGDTNDDPACGTPGCALGNYAFRRDLQHTFKLAGETVTLSNGNDAFEDQSVHKHFNISQREFEELFGGAGCGRAKTHEQAATYIEKFVVKQCMKQHGENQ